MTTLKVYLWDADAHDLDIANCGRILGTTQDCAYICQYATPKAAGEAAEKFTEAGIDYQVTELSCSDWACSNCEYLDICHPTEEAPCTT